MPYIDLQELEQLSSQLEAETNSLHWESAAASDAGKVRPINEDAYICSPEQRLWAVADGMGGHSRGDYASQAVVESLLYFSANKALVKAIVEIDSCLKKAHAVCRNTFAGERVGSTVAALYTYADHCFFIWAGDSRIYRLRQGELAQLTKDHTLAQQRCDRGELSPMMAALDPSANVLTRAIGVNQTLYVDLDYCQAQAGDRYLICSDGLYNELEQKLILQYLQQDSTEQAVASLLNAALEQGGRDNISAIVLDCMSSSRSRYP